MQTAEVTTNIGQTVTPEIERANARHLYMELGWMAVAFAMEWYYLQVYAIRLGAQPIHLGILTSGRALMLAIGSTFSHQWNSRFNNVIAALRWPIIITRFLLYMAIALVPFLPVWQVETLVADIFGIPDLYVFLRVYRIEILIFFAVISGLPHGMSQGVFLGMLPQAINKESLARIVSRRSVLMNVTILICMFVLGQLLERMPVPVNYQVGFTLAFIAGFLSWRNICAIVTPNVKHKHDQDKAAKPSGVWSYLPFRRFALVVLAVNVSVFIAAPLVQLHWVRGLGATDSWVSLFGIFEMGAGALLTLRLTSLINRFGARNLIIATTFATSIQMLIFGLTPTLPPVIIGQVVFGAGWFAVNVLLYNRLVEIVPHERMTQFAATYQVLVNFSLFLGPLIGTFLIENLLTIPSALLLIAGLRFGASVLTWVVRTEPEPVKAPVVQPVESLS